MDDDKDEFVLKVVAIITLGVIVLAAIIGLTLAAIFTDRNLARAEYLTSGAIALLAAMGGVSWFSIRKRRHWKVRVEREEDE